MKERYYYFKLSDGHDKMMSIKEARAHSDPAIRVKLQEIIDNLRNIRTTHDGFKPGYQPQIKSYCGGKLEYARALRERGLIEMGRNFKVEDPANYTGDYFKSDEMIKHLSELEGESFSDNELEAIKTGDYMKDVKVEI